MGSEVGGRPDPTHAGVLLMTKNEGSVTGDLANLQAGEDPAAAASALWNHVFGRLVAIAERMLRNTPRAASDGEDIALSAFKSLCEGAAQGRFTDLDSRDNLWRVLYTITLRKALLQKSHETAGKRDARRLVDADLDALVGHEPTPEITAILRDELRSQLDILRDDTLRQIALLALEGWSNEEIALRLDCSLRTVERKRNLIRTAWGREQAS